MRVGARRRLSLIRATALLLGALVACDSSPSMPDAHLPVRTFRMGFSAIPPKAGNDAVFAALEMWTPRADAAIMHVSVPYKALLTGTTATQYVTAVDLPLANYYRAKHLTLVVTLDVTNGLDRSAEAPELVELGRSVKEAAVQQVYRSYVQAMVSLVRPDYLGLAAETNLIRDIAPAPVYGALVQMTGAAAADVHAMTGSLPLLFVSVQVDDAWGRFLHASVYQGVERDYQDFPFLQVLGLSSYPYFVYAEPEEIPLDYYTRLRGGRTTPLMVVEGGWTSASVGSVQSSLQKQARYLRHHEKVLDSAKAIAVFQISFTDFDLASFPPQPPGSNLPLFAQLGLVNVDLAPKPALAIYDSIRARPLTP